MSDRRWFARERIFTRWEVGGDLEGFYRTQFNKLSGYRGERGGGRAG